MRQLWKINKQLSCSNQSLHTHTPTHILKNASLWRLLLFFLLLPNLRYSYRLCAQNSLWRPPVFRIPLWRRFVFCFFFCLFSFVLCPLSSVSTRYRISVHPQSCFTYTVWTFFCSHVFKVKFFKPLPFPLTIFFGGKFRQSLLLIFSSILRQITTYQNVYFLRKLRISNSRKHCVDVCKSTQCFKFLHCVDIFCSQVHTSYLTQNHPHTHSWLKLVYLNLYLFIYI